MIARSRDVSFSSMPWYHRPSRHKPNLGRAQSPHGPRKPVHLLQIQLPDAMPQANSPSTSRSPKAEPTEAEAGA